MNSGVRSQVAGVGSQVSGVRSQLAGHRSWLPLIIVAVLVIAVAAGLVYVAPETRANSEDSSSSPSPVSRVSLPLFFEANQGQTDSRVKFLARGAGYGLFLTSDEAVLVLQHPAVRRGPSSVAGNSSVIRMRLDGANLDAAVSGAELLAGKSNYFIGNNPKKWRRGIPQFARVNYESVYPGIDLTYYGNQRQLEYDFRVAPGADPEQIALTFQGASPHIEAGDLVLATSQGDVRFHAPEIYQESGAGKRTVPGTFRQLSANRIGFQIGPYDRSRELVIDPILTYSTYLGGSGLESLTRVAVDSSLNMYVAGSTTSAGFPTARPLSGGANRIGSQNVFIAQISPDGSTLNFATYLGSSGSDSLAGLAVDRAANIYVAGTTSSSAGDFPTTAGNAFQSDPHSGTHGFLSKLSLSSGDYVLAYSTYLAGDGVDTVTGLAIDKNQRQHAFVTGLTTSRNEGDGFPSKTNAYQLCPFEPNSALQNLTCTAGLVGPPQFFASQINTNGTGPQSMLYSTYFGGNNPEGGETIGGGIAADTAENMYFTGSTNLLGATGSNGEHPFPLVSSAQQSCLNQAGIKSCSGGGTPGKLDAFLVRINPAIGGTGGLVNSTYLGGSDDDVGNAVYVDGATNAYLTGETHSDPWNVTSTGQSYGGAGDAFIAKIGTLANSVYPLNFFRFLGGSGLDVGTDIVVNNVQGAHITGFTDSGNFPVTAGNNLPPGVPGTRDAFVALISTTSSAGAYAGLLGGGSLDQGTSIALNQNLDSSPAFVGGITQSGNLPQGTLPPLQPGRNGTQDSFLAKIGSESTFAFDEDASGVNPDPASAGNQVTFTFVFVNNGPDPAANVVFSAALPSSGFTFSSANSSPGGTCPNPVGNVLTCNVTTVASGAKATLTVVLVPTSGTTSLTVTPSISANGGPFDSPPGSSRTVNVTDFSVSADPKSKTITAGESASFVITLTPLPTYKNSISVSHSSLPTAATGTFTSSSVTISGNTPATTTLNISTTARPVTSGALWQGGSSFYATWLPIAGLSLLGLGAGLKRRRWLTGALLGLLAGLIVLQLACGDSGSTPPPTGGTPAGTYTITLTGSSGSASHNVPVTLVVN